MTTEKRLVLAWWVFVLLAWLALSGVIPVAAATPNPWEQLKQYVAELKAHPDDSALREKVIRLARTLDPPPAAPEGADELHGRALHRMKSAQSPADYAEAAALLKQVLLLAPWVGDYYFNLAQALEKAGQSGEAIANYQLYLLASPGAADARQVRLHIGELKDAAAIAAATPASGNSWTEPTTSMVFVGIPKGCFTMGSPSSEPGRYADEQQHQVCVEGFWLGKYAVTNAQFRQFRPSHDSGSFKGHSLNDDGQPVVNVSWNDAVAFAEWLSNKTGKRFRLPTEAEWEYAVRAGTTAARYWGDDPDAACRYANVYDRTGQSAFSFKWEGFNCDDGYAVTAPVGRFAPNAWGLYDMLGNVWQWTASNNAIPYDGSETRAASPGDGGLRVGRGGSWMFKPRDVRAASRHGYAPVTRHNFIGFRLARTP